VFAAADRGVAVIAMSEALGNLVRERLAAGEIGGMLGVGGSGGSSMVAPAMRLLPIGMHPSCWCPPWRLVTYRPMWA
jgi:uncharacterized protein (UPF0261 family)